MQAITRHREHATHDRPQLRPIHDPAFRVERLIVDLAHDPELAQPLDADPVGLGQRAEARCFLADEADADQRDVDVLRGLVDASDGRIAQESPPLALDLGEREKVLHRQRPGVHVRPVLRRHHAHERVREQVDQLERALAGERVEGEVAEPTLVELTDRLVEREPAREAHA